MFIVIVTIVIIGPFFLFGRGEDLRVFWTVVWRMLQQDGG